MWCPSWCCETPLPSLVLFTIQHCCALHAERQCRRYSREAPPSPTRAYDGERHREHHATPLQTPSVDNQTYEPPQRASPHPSFFPSVPPYVHHVARTWFIAILHCDWSNTRLVERHDAGIEVKSVRVSLRECPQHRMFTI